MLDRSYKTPEPSPGTRHIRLGHGKYAIVSEEDFEQLNKFNWCCDAKGYAVRASPRITGKQQKIQMHRQIMTTPEGYEGDHINRNRLDNRRINLRLVTHQQNGRNRSKRAGSSIFKGIYWNKRDQKWRAQIQVNNKRFHLGYFDNEIDAARAYDQASRKYHGEYGCLNFPDIKGSKNEVK